MTTTLQDAKALPETPWALVLISFPIGAALVTAIVAGAFAAGRQADGLFPAWFGVVFAALSEAVLALGSGAVALLVDLVIKRLTNRTLVRVVAMGVVVALLSAVGFAITQGDTGPPVAGFVIVASLNAVGMAVVAFFSIVATSRRKKL